MEISLSSANGCGEIHGTVDKHDKADQPLGPRATSGSTAGPTQKSGSAAGHVCESGSTAEQRMHRTFAFAPTADARAAVPRILP